MEFYPTHPPFKGGDVKLGPNAYFNQVRGVVTYDCAPKTQWAKNELPLIRIGT